MRTEIDTLFSGVSLRLAHAVLDRCDDFHELGEDKRNLVRYCVLDQLERRRPDRRRPLPAGPFEPFLADDEDLAGLSPGVPGLLSRRACAALWSLLKEELFGPQAADTAALIDAWARGEDPAGTCSLPLNALLRDPATRRRIAGRLAAGRPAHPGRDGESAPWTRFLDTAALLLEHLPLFRTALADFRSIYPDPPATDVEAEKQSLTLGRIAEEVAQEVPGAEAGSLAASLLPLIVLHADRRPLVIGFLLRHQAPTLPGPQAPLAEALYAHLDADRRRIRETLTTALNLNHRLRGAALRITAAERRRLEDALQRCRRLHAALAVAGLAEDSRAERAFRGLWDDLLRFIGERIAGVAAERIRVVATAETPPVDTAELVWLIGYLWHWRRFGSLFEAIHVPFDRWRTEVLEEVANGVDKLLRTGDSDPEGNRYGHLLTLAEVAQAFGRSILPWLPVSSPTLLAFCTRRLIDPAPLESVETALIGDFASLARDELRRTRAWPSAELAQLVRLAENRGLGTASAT